MEVEERASTNAYGVLIVTVAIIFDLFIAILILKPNWQKITETNKKISQATADLSYYEKRRDIIEKYLKNDVQKNLLDLMDARVIQILPNKDDRPHLYATIDGISKDLKIETKLVNESGTSQAVSIDGVSSTVMQTDFKITSAGLYTDLMKFLRLVQDNRKLLNVSGLSLNTEEGAKLTYDITISTYYKGEVKIDE
ncbi:MAG: hypothetical protein UT66_C0036G0002 [candidate division CPR2 bacterium GW2011_GWC1_39_9]|uniref:Uncharacterized protein n=1 Tax=candidate division CPR2 bacterium GW2011_GWC2_39_10 TaxID=1618345 RepID=A0A0G0Q0J0_UNCC2|nr:MAG: hypothetical protein UT18_C0003G0035 [candidate division CPR2 bacterium GW2011_GWC2_39_10]KKR33593.1 MAG: hypothetical protein UT66_C0036G0002 [candidate division CPR2 bacterium GW2011_GWC1_39_9]